MRAHKYLNQIGRLDALANNKLKEKQQVTELLLKVGDEHGRSWAKLRKLEKEIDSAIDRLVDRKMEAMAMLEKLPTDEYKVLHQYYVQGRTMEVIAAEQDISIRTAYRTKDRALSQIQAMLDDRKK